MDAGVQTDERTGRTPKDSGWTPCSASGGETLAPLWFVAYHTCLFRALFPLGERRRPQRPAKPATASFEGETHVSPSSPLPTSVGESVASLEPFSPCARRPRSVRGVLSGRPDRSHQVRSRRARSPAPRERGSGLASRRRSPRRRTHLPGTATCGRRASDRRRCLLHRT